MPDVPELSSQPSEPAWLNALVRKQPEIVFMGPFMAYLLLLAFNDYFPERMMSIPIAIRGIGGLWAVWLFRRYLPAWGKPHLLLAVMFGVLVAAGWVAGQHLFNGAVEQAGLAGKGYLFKLPEASDPTRDITAVSWWSQAVLRISVASITVPLVEELFWRAFLLRALIDWNHFERVSLGQFAWFSFLGTALLSTLEHPNNWGVSILCWFVYNGLFYWKRSILFLVVTHGVTNLALYIYVILYGDWMFW